VHTKSRELFIITIILICLGIALLTSKFGLSLALGAFLAGLIISESEYSAQALSDILPFKDSFIGLFFVSIGMLMNLGYFTEHHLHIELVVLVVFLLKVFTGTISAFVTGNPLRTSLHAGLSLAQVGEFSFVLAVAGKSAGLLTEELYQVFLSASVITMLLTPFMIKAAPSLASKITSFSFLRRLCKLKSEIEKSAIHSRKQGHVIIVGFGLNGRNLARVLRGSGIPYVVLEMNSDTVREMKKKGEPIFYGDGTSRELLHNLNITKARLLVIAISDPASTRSIVSIARRENTDIYIIVRTRYLIEVDDLTKLGANEVIPEEFETSVEIFSRVLNQYQIPQNVISDHVDAVRMDGYKVLRSVELPKKGLAEQHKFLEGIETETYLIKDNSNIDGHSVKDLRLRTESGVTIIAVQRGEKIHHNPSPDFVFRKQDVVLFIGKRKDIQSAREYLDSDRFVIEKYQR
jgi:CPA2 family monovalent cation:H+ antiporter-2